MFITTRWESSVAVQKNVSSDVLFTVMQAVRFIAAGGAHTVAVTDSTVFTWGSNTCGQLGSRTFRDKGMPTEVLDLAGKHVSQVACGDAHTLFLCRCCPLHGNLAQC